ncbi:hypothetical protein BCR35DRAFT_327418 [Leucosporidium creatinivorum]|uniref:Zinc-binding loop region of homing endonuclease domain-containing protein n=1 Tax=Leucosporidium creatinivorum TaxID=106004 RepID=A0A1Y2C6E8_9BASI|nr:hypothetical protein BCR35DRAFT_327418 [Leucosporidium creatinivorum]
MARAHSTPSPSPSPRKSRSSFTPRSSRTCTTKHLKSPYKEEEEDEDDLLSQIRRLNLPNTNIINVLSERYCTKVLLSIQCNEEDEHWLPNDRRARPKTNIGSHIIKAQDLTRRAGFLEGLKARKIQDLLQAALGDPSSRSDLDDSSVPIRLQCLAARSHYTKLKKPKPLTSLPPLQSSHLCHNPSCFSPSHLILETRAANIARNECRNCRNVIVEGEGGYSQFPCTHGDEKKGVPSCVLPTTRVVLQAEKSVTGGMAEMRRKEKKRRERERAAEVSKVAKKNGGAP